MVAEGLITRTTPPADRRKTVIAITTAGHDLVHAAQSAAIFARIKAQFGAEQLDHLLTLLDDIRALDLRR